MTNKERMRRAIEFDGPDYPPVMGGFSPATWARYREALVPYAERLGVPVPGDFDAMPKGWRAGESFRDNYGCLWECQVTGLQGIIKEHPLSDWSRLESYRFPDPLTQGANGVFDLPVFAAQVATELKEWTWAGGYENSYWERLHFLRGYEQTLMDLADEDERLFRLLDLILEHNLVFLRAVVETMADGVFFGDDWGDQQRLMIPPKQWRRIFKPGYRAMFQTCRKKEKHVFFHTDGFLMDVVPDLVECGVSVLNLQSRANGLDRIAAECGGRVCVAIDIDRQHVLPFGSPSDVRNHIRECVEKLDRHGGVIVLWNVNPDVPLANIAALTVAIEELRKS